MGAVISDENEQEVKPIKISSAVRILGGKVRLLGVRYKRSVVVQVMMMEV